MHGIDSQTCRKESMMCSMRSSNANGHRMRRMGCTREKTGLGSSLGAARALNRKLN